MFSEEFVKQLKAAWPFKRVSASKELLDRYNAQFNENIIEFAITVNDDTEVSDALIWKAMTSRKRWAKHATPLDFDDLRLKSAPPDTAMPKKSITE